MITKKELKKLIKYDYSTHKIADVLNMSQTNVIYWLKKHNLKTVRGLNIKVYKCKCGENRKENFYGHHLRQCKSCFNNYCIEKGREKRKYIVKKLGGKCKACGFDKFISALAVHHTIPERKDPNFHSIRGWSIKKIDKELEDCVLLCSNCHMAYESIEERKYINF